jgi:hypothetical protein
MRWRTRINKLTDKSFCNLQNLLWIYEYMTLPSKHADPKSMTLTSVLLSALDALLGLRSPPPGSAVVDAASPSASLEEGVAVLPLARSLAEAVEAAVKEVLVVLLLLLLRLLLLWLACDLAGTRRMFSGLRSQWMMFFSSRVARAVRI